MERHLPANTTIKERATTKCAEFQAVFPARQKPKGLFGQRNDWQKMVF